MVHESSFATLRSKKKKKAIKLREFQKILCVTIVTLSIIKKIDVVNFECKVSKRKFFLKKKKKVSHRINEKLIFGGSLRFLALKLF